MTKKKATESEAETIEEQKEELVEQATTQADELVKLQEELEKAQARTAEYLDGWQRSQAEFSNYKKRQEAERGQMMLLANANLLRKLLPIVDDFDRAIATLPDHLIQLSWCEGVLLIKHKLDAILESEGVKPIECTGQKFDPCYHEAVTCEETPGCEEDQILGEMQRGYMLGDRVLRPALVRVAKAPVQSEGSNSKE